MVIGFLVRGYVVGFITPKYGDVEEIFRYTVFFCKQFPGPCYGFLFKIIAKRPVTQHLEHGVMIGVVPHLFQVVMLS